MGECGRVFLSVDDEFWIAERDARPNDEERDQPHVPGWAPEARSSSSVSFVFDYIMEIFFLIAFAASVFGGIVGWFSRGSLLASVVLCIPLSFLILAVLMIASASSDGLTWQNWPDALIYYVIPFLVFIFTPCCVAGVLTTIVVHLLKRRLKHE